jgi:hypothetical protein
MGKHAIHLGWAEATHTSDILQMHEAQQNLIDVAAPPSLEILRRCWRKNWPEFKSRH